MSRKELKEIISAVIEKLQNSAPSTACGILWYDEPVATTLYGIGEEDPAPTPTPDKTPTDPPVVTTRYAIGEEDATTLYGINEEV